MRSKLEVQRARLVAALKNPPTEMLRRIRELKEKAKTLRARDDLLWYLLLQSAATQGNSRGWVQLRGDSAMLESVSYGALSRLTLEDCEERLLHALRKAKVRMPTIKAPRLAANLARIAEMGGVEAATQTMLNLKSRDAKLRFMRSFAGIGEKYGRNIWMDIYDPSFHDSIAVDARLKKVARELGFTGTDYRQLEAFYCEIALDAGLQPWELDRLLYNFTDYFLMVVGCTRDEGPGCCEGPASDSTQENERRPESNLLKTMSPDATKSFAECSAFYRDTLLSPRVLSKYRIGLIVREPTFCDATYKFGGFAAPHRYLIISANARCIDDFSKHPEWGLCIWPTGRLFKVIGLLRNSQHVQITLLEIPEELRQRFATNALTEMEQQFADEAARQFLTAIQIRPLQEHQTRLWLDRLELPIGMDDEGHLFTD